MATNPGTVLQVVCNFNMLYIGCQYQVIKKVKKKRKAYLPYLSFLQDEIGNTHIFFWPELKCAILKYGSFKNLPLIMPYYFPFMSKYDFHFSSKLCFLLIIGIGLWN